LGCLFLTHANRQTNAADPEGAFITTHWCSRFLAFKLQRQQSSGFCLVPSGGIVRMGQIAFASALLTLIVDCVFLMRLERVSFSLLWGFNAESMKLLISRAYQMRARRPAVSVIAAVADDQILDRANFVSK
jgi:hypothetical protein